MSPRLGVPVPAADQDPVNNGEFECLVPIDHRADRRIYPVGSVIRLDHLTAAQVERLVSRGYVRALPAATKAEPPVEG